MNLKPFILMCVLLTAPFVAGHCSEDKVIYGPDNRAEYYEVSSVLREIADSVCVQVHSGFLSAVPGGYQLNAQGLSPDPALCSYERFANQPYPGNCTCFLVGADLIVTAGHCIDQSLLGTYRYLFGFHLSGPGAIETTFPAADVYTAVELIGKSEGDSDWAVMRLDRPVTGRDPLSFRTAGGVTLGDPLLIVGHPNGWPLKLAGGAWVQGNDAADYFVANLDSYGGNSGSPVFNSQTLVVEGILVRGEDDWVYDGNNNCYYSQVCSDYGCRGEDCTRATEWADVVLANLPDDTPTPTWSLSPTPSPTRTVTRTPTHAPDDHGNTPGTATGVTPGVDFPAVIEYGGDVDFFSFQAVAGRNYLITTQLLGLPLTVAALYDTDGFSQLDWSSNWNDTGASRIEWIAPATGIYFTGVRAGQISQVGDYVFKVSDISPTPTSTHSSTPNPTESRTPTLTQTATQMVTPTITQSASTPTPTEVQSGPTPTPANIGPDGFYRADSNRDGQINHSDLLLLMRDFGVVYPTPTP